MAQPSRIECPFDDQGLVRPLVTSSGEVVFMCDEGGEVWLCEADIRGVAPVVPTAPDWGVSAHVHVKPGTTHWAD
jgi:hypothetical protein